MKEIERRIDKVEKELTPNKGKVPPEDCIQTICVYGLNDAQVKEKIDEAKKRILEKHGTTEGLIIYQSRVPEPDPLPEQLLTRTEKIRNSK